MNYVASAAQLMRSLDTTEVNLSLQHNSGSSGTACEKYLPRKLETCSNQSHQTIQRSSGMHWYLWCWWEDINYCKNTTRTGTALTNQPGSKPWSTSQIEQSLKLSDCICRFQNGIRNSKSGSLLKFTCSHTLSQPFTQALTESWMPKALPIPLQSTCLSPALEVLY